MMFDVQVRNPYKLSISYEGIFALFYVAYKR